MTASDAFAQHVRDIITARQQERLARLFPPPPAEDEADQASDGEDE